MVNFASYNVRGLGNLQKRKKVFNYLRYSTFEIIYLQETHSSKEIEKFWKSMWCGQIIYAHNNSKAGGTAILIKKGIRTCNSQNC